MSKRFITFKPVTGVYEKAIQPYKKWYELADMSPLIEVDGEYTRILRTTGWINKLGTRKMVMCDKNGELIRDEAFSRKSIKVLQYLDAYQSNRKGIISSSRDDTSTKLVEFITEFKKILENVAPKLTENEMKAMKYHLDYYGQTKRYTELIAKDANQLLPYLQKLQGNQIEKFSSSFIKWLGDHFNRWEKNKYYTQALLIENNIKAKKTVRRILRNPDYQSFFPNQEIKKQMLDEMLQSEMAANRFIMEGKEGWKREQKWLNPDKGKFNLEIGRASCRERV